MNPNNNPPPNSRPDPNHQSETSSQKTPDPYRIARLHLHPNLMVWAIVARGLPEKQQIVLYRTLNQLHAENSGPLGKLFLITGQLSRFLLLIPARIVKSARLINDACNRLIAALEAHRTAIERSTDPRILFLEELLKSGAILMGPSGNGTEIYLVIDGARLNVAKYPRNRDSTDEYVFGWKISEILKRKP
jgi:hypothetical protein